MMKSLFNRAARDHSAVWATAGTLLILVVALYSTPPHAPIELSQASWAAIRRIESNDTAYAADVLNSARQHHNRAWMETQEQLNRPRPLRSFYRAEILFIQAMGLAEAADALGQFTPGRTRNQMIRRVDEARRNLTRFERELRHSLRSVSLRGLATKAELKVSLAEQQLADANATERMIADAENAVSELGVALSKDIDADSAMAPVWDDWLHETLEWTLSTDSSAVLVVKDTHCGYLLRGGLVITSFSIELGYRSGRQKMHSGDGATPEGMFRVVARRDTGATYYRALDLDYPTFPDSIRYHVAKKLGTVPAGTGIGGNIQIHGEGGRRTDWTEGCVAVTNNDMDMLMERLEVGDRVTIVRQLNGWPQ